MAVTFNKSFNVNRLVKRILYTIIGLLVGGIVMAAFVTAFGGYCSPFFNGLGLIGVNVTYGGNSTTTWAQSGCNFGTGAAATSGNPYTIGTSGNFTSGVLTITGVISVAGIIMTEFVNW